MSSPVDYLILTVVHRTNEDWFLQLPLEIDDLDGATAACALESIAGVRIELQAVVVDEAIVLQAESEEFAYKLGAFSGDVLLTLSGGRSMVTHVINLDLQRGVT